MNYLQELSKRIPMEGTINTRDLGGYCGYEGRTIKYGKIIRTDNLSRITEKDIAYFQNVLKASYDIDLRSASEIKGKADLPIPGCEFVHCP
ncbi:MAG: tyrosine-protein phosphatase, partial [Bacilli bacterium]